MKKGLVDSSRFLYGFLLRKYTNLFCYRVNITDLIMIWHAWKPPCDFLHYCVCPHRSGLVSPVDVCHHVCAVLLSWCVKNQIKPWRVTNRHLESPLTKPQMCTNQLCVFLLFLYASTSACERPFSYSCSRTPQIEMSLRGGVHSRLSCIRTWRLVSSSLILQYLSLQANPWHRPVRWEKSLFASGAKISVWWPKHYVGRRMHLSTFCLFLTFKLFSLGLYQPLPLSLFL